MKPLYILILSFLTGIQPLFSQDYFHKKENRNRRHLILVHPTRSNLERYSYLLEEGILDPGKLKIVGLYFEAENYDYSEVIKDYPQFGFHMIEDTLTLNELFQENEATDDFKLIFKNSKGIIFNGGPDIPPATYNEEMLTLTRVTDPYRHYFELSFLFHILGGNQNDDFKPFIRKRPKYSVLGICLGMQTMNVAAGGTLIQDIPSEIYEKNTIEDILSMNESEQHRNYYTNLELYPEIKSYYLHPIEIIPGRWLNDMVEHNGNLTPSVLSSHHQSIEKPGANYRIAARSVDGKVIEAIEHIRYPNVIGIQFHPEVDYLYMDKPNYKTAPEEEIRSLKQELIRHKSLEFHLGFWRAFSESL